RVEVYPADTARCASKPNKLECSVGQDRCRPRTRWIWALGYAGRDENFRAIITVSWRVPLVSAVYRLVGSVRSEVVLRSKPLFCGILCMCPYAVVPKQVRITFYTRNSVFYGGHKLRHDHWTAP